MRPIDADALIEFIDMGHLRNPLESCFSERDVVDMLESQPTIEQPKWISCAERLPDCEWGAESPEPVLYKMKDTGTVYAGLYGTGGLCRDRYFRQYHKINTNGVDVDDVACWMYQSALPEPPKGDE